MATKTFNLINKNDNGNTITASTVKIGPNSGFDNNGLYFNISEFPKLKTLEKWELNFYCKSGGGQVARSGLMRRDGIGSGMSVEYNLSNGWNKVTKTSGLGYLDESHTNPHLDVSTMPTLEAYDIEIYTHNSTYKPYVILTYKDTAPLPPTGLSPSSGTLNSGSTIKLSWAHKSQEGKPQTGFTLEYNNGTSWIPVSQNTSNQYYNLPANTLPTNKTIQWRVKTKEANGLESGFASASFKTRPKTPSAPTGLLPSATYKNPKEKIRFSWVHNNIDSPVQKSFILEYSTNSGANWIPISQTTSNQYYEMSANQLPLTGTVTWRVKTTDGNDATSVFSTTSFTLRTPPNAPSSLSPNETNANIEDVIRFSWRHNSNEGRHQSGFTLQYSSNNGTTWATVSQTSTYQYYNMPANTFTTSAAILWKIKTVDGNGEEGPYSNVVTFYAKAPPNAPTSLYPSGIALNPKNPIQFTWVHNSEDGLGQKGFTLEYSLEGEGGWTTISQTTPNQYYEMPASKLPLVGILQWRLKTVDSIGLTSSFATDSFTLKTPPNAPTSLYPENIILNPREVIKFSWLHNSNSGLGQKGFTLQYSIDGGSIWTTASETTANQYYDLSANTLPTTGTALWKVMTIDGNGDSSTYTSASFTLGAPPQQAPLPIQPIGAYLDSTKPIKFEWNFVGGTPGETQTKYDLEYSIDGGKTWVIVTETTAIKHYELPGNTFGFTGNIIWRVRTYNNFDEISPYCENNTFNIISSPPIPQIIDISNQSRPTITWTSQDQNAFELQVIKGNEVIINTGSNASVSDRTYKLLEYLKDGDYKVKIRVINKYNLYSPWAEKTFTISTAKPQAPEITVFGREYSVVINVVNENLKTFIYRDEEFIGEVIDGSFTDFTGENKKYYKYYARTIDENDNFNDSNVKVARCKFNGNTLALVESPGDYLKLQYGFGVIPQKSNTMEIDGSLIYYAGREDPVAEYSEFISKAKTVTFTLRTKSELDKLKGLINARKTLLFRDRDGDNIYGTVFKLDDEKNILGFYEIGFTITKTDYKGAAYD